MLIISCCSYCGFVLYYRQKQSQHRNKQPLIRTNQGCSFGSGLSFLVSCDAGWIHWTACRDGGVAAGKFWFWCRQHWVQVLIAVGISATFSNALLETSSLWYGLILTVTHDGTVAASHGISTTAPYSYCGAICELCRYSYTILARNQIKLHNHLERFQREFIC